MKVFHLQSKYKRLSDTGFSLVQVSVLVLAGGLVAAAVLPDKDNSLPHKKYTITHERMEKIDQATKRMMTAFGRRPCPASGEYYASHAKFGKEDGSPGNCGDSGATNGLLTPFNDTNVIAGTVPIKTLNLPDEYYFDGWGRPFTYVVDKRSTEREQCVQMTGTGDVEMYDGDGGTLKEKVMYSLISHGKDGHGAFQSAGSTRANRIDMSSTDADQINNAGVSGFTGFDIGGSNPAAFVNEWVSRETDFAGGYDDVVSYSQKYKNTCCVGKSCGVSISLLCPIPPGNFSEPRSFAEFDGADDYISVGSLSSHFTNSYSISIWVKANSLTNTSFPSPFASGGWNGAVIHSASDGTVYAGTSIGGRIQTSAGYLTTNAWTHIVITLENGVGQKLYKNGVQTHSNANYPVPIWSVGKISTDYAPWAGSIRDVRIYNDVLTANEVAYLYTNGTAGTNPSSQNLVGHWPLDEESGSTAYDRSTRGNNGTLTNVADPADFWNPNNAFAHFDGVDDRIEIGAISRPSTWSITGWINPASNSDGDILFSGSGPGNYIGLIAYSGNMRVYESDGTSYTIYQPEAFNATNYPSGKWTFVSGVANGTTLKFYRNGVEIGSGTSYTSGATADPAFKIGGGSVSPFDGSMKDIRLYNDPLSATEITYLATHGASGSDPGGANLVGHWLLNEGSGTAAADNGNTCQADGTLTNVTDETSFWNDWSYAEFDGTNDYVGLPNEGDFEGLANASWCFWMYPDSLTNNPIVMTKAQFGGTGAWRIHASGIAVNTTGGGWYTPGASLGLPGVSVGQWQHVCYTYDGSNIRSFLNGTNIGMSSPAISGSIVTTDNNPVRVGWQDAGNTSFFNGKLRELRIYNKALTLDNIAYLYTRGASGTAPRLVDQVGHWRLNEGSGTNVGDSSPEANHGTATNITAADFWNPNNGGDTFVDAGGGYDAGGGGPEVVDLGAGPP